MYFQRLHCENVSCGICSLDMKDIESLDTHSSNCERFKCSWCDKSFDNVIDIKSHSRKEHKGKNYLYHYNRMRINEEFFSENLIYIKDLV